MKMGIELVPEARKQKIRYLTKYWLQPVLTLLALSLSGKRGTHAGACSTLPVPICDTVPSPSVTVSRPSAMSA